MPIEIPETVKQFLSEKAYGHVVTRNPDGSPQVSMVWMDVDGKDVLFNTAEGRVKSRNLAQRPTHHHLGPESCRPAGSCCVPRDGHCD